MPVIDLKNANIYLLDGYAGPSQAGGLVNNIIANPLTVPTVNVTGGGSMGGLLGAGVYVIAYTWIDAAGETLPSPDSIGFTVVSGDIPRVTVPTRPTNATGVKFYLSTAGGGTGTETLYPAVQVTTTTFDLPVVATGLGASPPVSNTTSGYPTGTTTITVDGFSGAVAVGDRFTVGGETSLPLPVHVVVSHTETSSNTTSITFTAALLGGVLDEAAVTILPHKLKIKIGDGNLTYDEKRKIKYVLDRGILDSVKLEDQEPFDVTIDFMWEFLAIDSAISAIPSFEEALKQIGNASNWVSSAPDKCQPYCVDIEIDNMPPCPGTKAEIYRLPQFRWESLKHDPKTSLVASTGKCNALLAIVSRVADASRYTP